MTTLANVDIALSFDEFVEAQDEALRRPDMTDQARAAFEQAAELVSAAIAYDWCAVTTQANGVAEVGGEILHLGRHGNLLAPAHTAFVAVVTIGAALENRARELRASGQTLGSFMLDEVGVLAVGKTILFARSLAEKGAAERGWGVGAELAPGQLAGWDIAEQKLVTKLLHVESIGVTVTDSGMLVPQKSASLLVGIGSDYQSAVVQTPCAYCDLSETCRFRH